MAYGTVNADVIGTSVAGSNLGAGDASLMKNRIINGAMVIDQRNAGASVTNSSSGTPTYILDRWGTVASQASKFTVQQNAGSVTPPTGFTNYLGVTSSSAYSRLSTDYFGIVQPIEGFNVADLGWGTADAKTVTFSFWVRSSLTGTFAGRITNSSSARSYVFTYSINSANTWEFKTITIVGDTSGTWLTTNGTGISLWLDLGSGSNYQTTAGSWQTGNFAATSSSTSVVGTSGATFYITGVQLEVGSSATGFEYRIYSQEYDLCRRYYEQFNFNGTASSTVNQYLAIGMGWATADGRAVLSYYPKRAQPSSAVNGGTLRFATSAGGVTTGSGWTFDQAGPNNVLIYNSTLSGFTAGQALQLTGQSAGNISISAEL